jgi:glycosyltransferase involved in cell wall biosynthesis
VTRLLVVSSDRVGPFMTSVGVRAYHLAQALAGSFDVTLMVPNSPGEVELDGVEVIQASRPLSSGLGGFDAVVAEVLPLPALRDLARRDVRTIYDLYVPSQFESLSSPSDGGADVAPLFARAAQLALRFALATGDAFVCASERQRDLWLGMLGGLGRIDRDVYRRDPTLRGLIDVVPFGLPAAAPVPGARVLKGVWPGIGEDDRVLLWAGGIVDWLDPLTPIRAMELVAQRRPDVKLLFLGLRPPQGVQTAMAAQAVALARALGLLDRVVFFNEGWVPYAERQGYLLEADLGVSAHFDSLETRYAFRTRLLDHFWAGLPTLTSAGDVLAELVAARGLGRVLAVGDVQGWAEAIVALLDDEAERARIARNLEPVRRELAWPRAVEPLARLAREPGSRAGRPRGSVFLRLDDLWLRSRISYARRGALGALANRARATSRRARAGSAGRRD